MSWNPIDIADLDLGFIDNKIRWTCPRCGHRQHFLQTTRLFTCLLYGLPIKCQNIGVCGDGQSHFELKLTIDGGVYKGLNDRPLAVPDEQHDRNP